jgi:small-conductance mechanosensitive channel
VPGESHFLDIARVIQLAVAPVFLLTAIGTIINVLIARLARAVDRRRILEEHLPEYLNERREQAERELGMLHRRITLVIWATALAVLAALFVCLLIGTAFAGAFIATDLSRPVAALFIAAVAALTACLLIFLREISIAAVSARQTLGPQAGGVARTKTTAATK